MAREREPKGTSLPVIREGDQAFMPARNGGKLQVGNPGNRGGTGQPPKWFREEVRKLLAEKTDIAGKRRRRLEFAIAVLDGDFPEATISDRQAAWRDLMKLAVPNQSEVTGADGEPLAVEMTVRFVRPDADG